MATMLSTQEDRRANNQGRQSNVGPATVKKGSIYLTQTLKAKFVTSFRIYFPAFL